MSDINKKGVNMWPFKKKKIKHYEPEMEDVLIKEDKELLSKKKLEQGNLEFKKEYGILTKLLRRFKKFKL